LQGQHGNNSEKLAFIAALNNDIILIEAGWTIAAYFITKQGEESPGSIEQDAG
jgi:hypothetical protein